MAASRASKPANGIAAELAARPDDTALQAVYADYLIEQGGEQALRGELIQLERSPNKRSRARADEVAAELDRAWTKQRMSVVRERGFVRQWRCRPSDLASHAAAVFEAEPLLTGLALAFGPANVAEQVRAIAATPQLARVRRLELIGHRTRTGRPGAKGLGVLLDSPHWPALEALALPGCAIGDAGAKLLANAHSLANLRELDLFESGVLSRGVVAIAESRHLAALTTLRLEGNKIGMSGMRAIANTTTLTKLTTINLRNTWLSEDNLAPVSRRFPGALEPAHW